jgi:hypothetical protein
MKYMPVLPLLIFLPILVGIIVFISRRPEDPIPHWMGRFIVWGGLAAVLLFVILGTR